ncbi:hypothetical protein DFH07DRAFT_117850 [Mycena maculata]|uniref:Uncharacterized protein n=1 Tax=Mycena maculata TaxID=230809 RepID=A0AAD7MW05_9AGAR|nr:hypothetical protein DFH07DRAFT_117850 [Mycena maculata]
MTPVHPPVASKQSHITRGLDTPADERVPALPTPDSVTFNVDILEGAIRSARDLDDLTLSQVNPKSSLHYPNALLKSASTSPCPLSSFARRSLTANIKGLNISVINRLCLSDGRQTPMKATNPLSTPLSRSRRGISALVARLMRMCGSPKAVIVGYSRIRLRTIYREAARAGPHVAHTAHSYLRHNHRLSHQILQGSGIQT